MAHQEFESQDELLADYKDWYRFVNTKHPHWHRVSKRWYIQTRERSRCSESASEVWTAADIIWRYENGMRVKEISDKTGWEPREIEEILK